MIPDGFALKEFEFRGSTVRYLEGGRGFPVVMMHGAGPGASVASAFARIFSRLVGRYHVFAMDFLGFGQSGPMPGGPRFDFALWTDQVRELIKRMPQGNVGIFGHSMSGAMALRVAAETPQVTRLFTTGSVGTSFPLNRHLEALWTFPASKEELRRNLGSLIFDTSSITDAIVEERWQILNSGDYRQQFTAMFGGDKQAHINSWEISRAELERIKASAILAHGRNDLPCPPELTSLKIAESLPQADVALLARCGHAPSIEHPDKIWSLVQLAFPDSG